MKQIVEKAFLKTFIFVFFSTSLFFSFPVFAQDCTTCCAGGACPADTVCICNPLEADTIEELIENIIDFIVVIAIALAPLMALVGAFYILTSAGEPKRVQTGKDIILYTFVGLLIVFLAKGIINAIRFVLGG